jgi:hypothetical protein
MRLLVVAGEKCERLIGSRIKGLRPEDVECDEIWGYCAKKEAHKTKEEEDNEGLGDAYCFVAMERNTKLIMNFTPPHALDQRVFKKV